MNISQDNSPEKPPEDFRRSWRYKIGMSLIIIGHLCLLIGLLLPIFGLASGRNTKFVGVLVLGGEVITLSSIIFLGKAGFKVIKNKMFGFVKAGYVAKVGPKRHYFGIALLFTNVLTTYTTALYAQIAFKSALPEDPFPFIWGLNFAQQGIFVLWLFLIGEISFFIAIYILGSDWWERFRNIIIWKKSYE